MGRGPRTLLVRWSRFWVVIYPNGLWTAGPKWGDVGFTYGMPGKTWGSTATRDEVVSVQSIVRDWKPAGTRCVNIIIAFDNTSFDPTVARDGAGLPDGTWGNWGKLVGGVWLPARLSTARFLGRCPDTFASETGLPTYSRAARAVAAARLKRVPFVQPAVGSTVVVPIDAQPVAAIGKGAEVAGGGFYVVTNVAANSVTLLNRTSSVNLAPGQNVPLGAAVTFGGLGAPQSGDVKNGQAQVLVDGGFVGVGQRPVNHFSSYNSSTTDGTVNAAAFEAMLADAASNGLDCYCPSGVYKQDRPIFWTQHGVRVRCPKVWDASDTNAFKLQPLLTNATDWYGPQIIMGAETPEPLWTGPDAHGMYGMPLGNTAISNDEPAYINLSSLDALSLNGVGAIAIDVKYFYPTGEDAGSQWAIFYAGGGSVQDRRRRTRSLSM